MSNGTTMTAQGGRSSGVFNFLGKLFGSRSTFLMEESERSGVNSPVSENQQGSQIMPFTDPVVGAEQTPVVRTVVQASETPSLVQEPAVEVKESLVVTPPLSVKLIEEEDLHSVLFQALQQAEPIKQDFRVGELIHELFTREDLLSLVAKQLAVPYADGEKKIGAVAGMGIYGDRLARALQDHLPSVAGMEENHHPVLSFPLDQCCEKGKNVWGFASDNRVGQQLRAKRVLLVLPVLTRSSSEDVEACIRHIEERLGTNTTVFGVVTVFALNPKKAISRTRGKPLIVNSLLTLGFSW